MNRIIPGIIVCFCIGMGFAWIPHDGSEQRASQESGRKSLQCEQSKPERDDAAPDATQPEAPAAAIARGIEHSPYDQLLAAARAQRGADFSERFHAVLSPVLASHLQIAVRFMREHIHELPANAVMPVLEEWSRIALADAMAWIESVPDEQKRLELLRGACRQWAFIQPIAYEDWLSTLDASDWRDELISAHLSAARSPRFRERFLLAASLQDGNLQIKHRPTLFALWRSTDEAGATVWLEQQVACGSQSPLLAALAPAIAACSENSRLLEAGTVMVSTSSGQSLTIHY